MLEIAVTFAFKSSAACVNVDIGLFKSRVLFMFKIADAFAFESNAVCVAVEIGLFKSLVLLQFPKPTIVAVTPETAPAKDGEAILAFKFKAV
jgi:hypothetical protein